MKNQTQSENHRQRIRKYGCRILLPFCIWTSVSTGYGWAAVPPAGDGPEQNLRAKQQAAARQERQNQPDVFLQKTEKGKQDRVRREPSDLSSEE
jgi:hypothetical protein